MTAFGSISTRAPLCSTTSSKGFCSAAQSSVYSMPAQPPFLTPMRRPAAPVPFSAVMALMRSAARSDSFITCGLGLGVLMQVVPGRRPSLGCVLT